jgi:GNAT superfamily N-acetyltransferase
MYWRLRRSAWEKGKGAANKRAFGALVRDGKAHGVLAYVGGRVAGWCALGPRGEFPALERSRVLKPVDDAPVWSIVCFFILPAFRRQGIATRLLEAAVAHARRKGARLVEGYPIDPDGDYPPAFAWTGLAASFRQARFAEVARRSPTRPIMRRRLTGGSRPRPR